MRFDTTIIMSIRSFLRMTLSGSVGVACLAGAVALAAEPAAPTPTPETKTETAATPTPAPEKNAEPAVPPAPETKTETAATPTPAPQASAAKATPKAPTDRKAMLAQIQNDILLFRREFIARMVRAKEDRHAVFENLQEKLDELNAVPDDSQASKEHLAKAFERLRAEIEQYGEQITALEQSITTMETDMTARLDDIQKGAKSGKLRPRPAMADLPVEGTSTEGEEEDSLNLGAGELFRLAHRYFMEKEYDVAIGGFHKFLTDFSDHQLAGAAQFWIAESFLQLGEYDIALQEYARLIKTYPRDEKVADAYYGTGVALLKQGNTEDAKQALQYVISHFSDTLAANKAQTRLKDIP